MGHAGLWCSSARGQLATQPPAQVLPLVLLLVTPDRGPTRKAQGYPVQPSPRPKSMRKASLCQGQGHCIDLHLKAAPTCLREMMEESTVLPT